MDRSQQTLFEVFNNDLQETVHTSVDPNKIESAKECAYITKNREIDTTDMQTQYLQI